MEQVKKRSIALALCCCFVCSPVWAKTFVGVLYPLFGPMAAIGLVELVSELRATPDVEVATYLHQSWPSLVNEINRQPKGTHILIIGYSLGANNAVLVANSTNYVDSIIALQPSMFTSNPTLTGRVGRIVEIYNPNRWMTFGGMGSQKLDGPNIEYVESNDSHPGAQFNSDFRNLVKSEVARLSALDRVPVKIATMKIAQSPSMTRPPMKPASSKPTSPKVDVDLAQALPSQQRVPVQTAFSETPLSAVSSSKNSAQLLVQRALTIADMKDYVKRTYPASHSAGLTN
jgi:hypothetical protein